MEYKTEAFPYNVLATEAYIIYLRKSRADNPDESVEEVLAKHETLLQDLAVRELGGRIPEHCIFREVVSGETIEERPKMQEVLAAIENPAVKMVLVVEPPRLSRGDLVDCGNVVNAFRYSNTKIMTQQMTYDLQNKMHRKFFEQELMRGNDFLEYTKEILMRGRILSVQKGNYLSNTPPFGYNKITDAVGPTLEPNENADAVRLIYDLYLNHDMNYLQIARHLDSIGVKPAESDHWEKTSVSSVLHNLHYTGRVFYGTTKTVRTYEDGRLVKKSGVKADADEMIIAQGRHEVIIPDDIFQAVQEKINNNPRKKEKSGLKNPLAGLLVCQGCNKVMALHPYEKARDRYECKTKTSVSCKVKSVVAEDIINAIVFALESENLPDLQAKLESNDGQSAVIQQRQLKKLRTELDELKEQETKQYIFLEKGIYTEDVFLSRNKALHVEMEELKTRIYDVSKTIPKEIDYREKVVRLEQAIAALRDNSLEAEPKNKLLKRIISRIEYEFIPTAQKGEPFYRLHIHLLL